MTAQMQQSNTSLKRSEGKKEKRRFWLLPWIIVIVLLLLGLAVLWILNLLELFPKRWSILISAILAGFSSIFAAFLNKDIRDFCSDLITKLKPLNKSSSPPQTTSTQQLPPVSPSGQIPTAPVMSSQAEEEDIPDMLNGQGGAEASHAEIHIRVIAPPPRTSIPTSQSVFLFNEHLTDSQEFYGRKRERASFIERCRKGASTSIIGPRRIGKTWLLEYLLLEASTLLGHKYRVGYLDATMPKCRSVSGFVAIALEQLGVQVSSKQALLSLEALEEAVEKLKQHHLSPILCIDEFEGFTNKQEFDVHFFSGLRAISHNGLALVIASKKTLFQVVGNDGDTSGFFNIFETFILKPFDEKEAKSFLMEKGGQAKFTEQEQLHLLKYSQMQGRSEWLPLRLQLAGKMLLEDRDQDSYIPDDVHYWWNFKERLEEQYSTVVVSK